MLPLAHSCAELCTWTQRLASPFYGVEKHYMAGFHLICFLESLNRPNLLDRLPDLAFKDVACCLELQIDPFRVDIATKLVLTAPALP